jgi:hypothetical protein
LSNISLAAGQELLIVVDGWGSDVGDYTLDITAAAPPPCDPPPPPPVNDDCAAVVPVALPVPGVVTFTGDNCGATFNDCAAFAAYADVWEAFTITEPAIITLDYCTTTPAFGNAWLNLALDCACTGFTPGATYDFTSCGDGNLTLTWGTLAAGTYYYPVLLDIPNGAAGPYTIHVTADTPPTAPANDLCDDAEALTFPASVQATTFGATMDVSFPTCGTTISGPGVWYTIQGTGNTMTATTCNAYSAYDTKLNIYCGGCAAPNCVTGNDDNCTGFGGLLSTVTWCSDAAETYYVLVQGFGGQSGDFQLDITDDGTPCPNPPNCIACPPPANDNCVDVTPIPLNAGSPLLFTGDNCGATMDCPSSAPYGEAWFAFTTTEVLNVNIDYCGSSPAFGNVFIVIYDQCPCGPYIFASNFDNFSCDGNWTVRFENLPAGTYYYPILTDVGSVGPFNINVNGALPPPAPPNDNCFDVTPVALGDGGVLTFTGDNYGATMDCPTGSWDEVWHAISTTECLDVTVEYCGTSPAFANVYIVMADACPCGPWIFAGDWDNFSCPDGNWTVRWFGLPAGDYWFPILEEAGSVGPYTMTVSGAACPPPPANDDCAFAELIGDVTDLPFNTQAATFDGAGACMTSNNIWYLHTASATGPVVASLCGSSFDTRLAVYDGPDCPSVVPPPPPVPLAGGEDFGTAVDLGPLPAAYTGSTAGFIDDNTPTCMFSAGAPDAFYYFVAASTGVVNIEYCGSTYDTGLDVFDDTFAEIACNDDFCGLQSAFYGIPVEAGRTYYVVVDGFSSGFGDYVMAVTQASYVMIECNDDFCGLQSQIIFDAIAGNQYVIEVGGFSSGVFGDGFLTVGPYTPPPDPCDGALYSNHTTPPTIFNAYATQCDPVYPFQAGVADDFILPGPDAEIGSVVTYIAFWNGAGDPSMVTDINVTIYADNGGFPGGRPIGADPACGHEEDLPGGIVTSEMVPTGSFQISQAGSVYQLEIDITDITLSVGTVYWLEVAPVMSFAANGQCGWTPSDVVNGLNAVQIFELLGPPYDTWQSGSLNFSDMAFCLQPPAPAGGCVYIPGDINNFGGANGIDVTYAVSYFKGGAEPPIDCNPPCTLVPDGPDPGTDPDPAPDPFFASGDVNGNCQFNGIDVTYYVAYLKELQPALLFCPTCPPAALSSQIGNDRPTIIQPRTKVQSTQE